MNSATIASPMGPFSIIATGDEVLASGWTANPAELSTLIAPSLATPLRSSRDLGLITDAARAYFDGDLTSIDPIPVRQHSGPFLEQAWQVLRTVSAGSPISYAEFASRVGRPGAARAAASACSRNAAALFVPCHRIVRTGGDLGGFRWGVAVKRQLLAHEQGELRMTAPALAVSDSMR
jgi:methylated-DNA-[protein]-cysteine S-methyltransferase